MKFDNWLRKNKKRYGHVSPAQEIALRDAFEAGVKTEREAREKIAERLVGLIRKHLR